MKGSSEWTRWKREAKARWRVGVVGAQPVDVWWMVGVGVVGWAIVVVIKEVMR